MIVKIKRYTYWPYAAAIALMAALVCLALTNAHGQESTTRASRLYATAQSLVDSDADGLEDALEANIGTNPKAVDTDGDGLSDYEEYCKYRTDPAKKDSDGDGKPDSDWDERREYTYTIRAICQIRPPDNIEGMNDLYQDARPAAGKASFEDAVVVEVLVFPFAEPRVNAQQYPYKSIPNELQKYVQRTLSMNFSPEMQEEVKGIVEEAATDIEAVQKILDWIANETRLANTLPEFAYFHIKDNKIVWHNPLGSPAENKRLLKTNFFADSMFKKKVHGTCSSTAILRGAMLRAAGLPTRIIQTLPLINRYEGDPEPLADRMRRRIMARGYEWGAGGGGANHMYNEVYLNHHWIRVDSVVNTGPFVGDKLFVKVYSAADFNNLYSPRLPEDAWNENREFRTLDVSDAFPKYESEFETLVDVAIRDNDLSVRRLPDGRFEASIVIHNNGNVPTPSFHVMFYAGDPDEGARLADGAVHGAGPIMPRSVWKEGTGPFRLKEDEKQIVVVIDPDNTVEESDETNNRAARVVRNGSKGAKAGTGGLDLYITEEDIYTRLNTEGKRYIGVKIHSKGSGKIPLVNARFFEGKPGRGAKSIGQGGLSMEAGTVAKELIPWDAVPGEYEIFVVIDPDNEIPESDESNNSASRLLIID